MGSLPRRKACAAAVAVIALLVSATAGCSSAAKAQALPPPPLGQVTVVSSQPASYSLPLDSYFATVPQATSVAEAYNLLLGSCLKPFGMKLDPLPSIVDTALPNPRLYGLVSLSAAEASGYDQPPPPAPPQLPTVNVSEPAEYVQVMNGLGATAKSGIPQGGCLGQVQRKLGGSQYDGHLVNDLQVQAWNASQADSRALAGNVAWSACMAKKGFKYANPWDPNNAQWPQTPSQVEIRTATADVQCKISTNLVGIWYAVNVAYEKQTIEKDAQELQTNQAALNAMISAAEKVVAGQGVGTT